MTGELLVSYMGGKSGGGGQQEWPYPPTFQLLYSAPQEETENHFFQHSVHLFCDGTW